jgi:hypothetical protein
VLQKAGKGSQFDEAIEDKGKDGGIEKFLMQSGLNGPTSRQSLSGDDELLY